MKKYSCPMHGEIQSDTPGYCLICGMTLVEAGGSVVGKESDDYTPLVTVIGLILAVIFTVGFRDHLAGAFSWHMPMMSFMAGMFIVFAGFKLLDLKGFAEGYATYDLVAEKWYGYGYIYPFVELTLGLLYLGGMNTFWLHLFTFVLMSINGLGVAIKLFKKQKFQCACLGTFLKVPLTKVSLVENFGMALMALYMLM